MPNTWGCEIIIQIGIVSGEILTLFDDEVKGPLTLKEIELHLNENRDDVLMSLGWLEREGYLNREKFVGSEFYIRARSRKLIFPERKETQYGIN